MITPKLSNFYLLGESKEIYIKEQTINIDWDSSSEDKKEVDSFYPEDPYCTIVEGDLEYEYILKLIKINCSPWF